MLWVNVELDKVGDCVVGRTGYLHDPILNIELLGSKDEWTIHSLRQGKALVHWGGVMGRIATHYINRNELARVKPCKLQGCVNSLVTSSIGLPGNGWV
jgi:hypothetical protein